MQLAFITLALTALAAAAPSTLGGAFPPRIDGLAGPAACPTRDVGYCGSQADCGCPDAYGFCMRSGNR
jgi:hypothetical protein